MELFTKTLTEETQNEGPLIDNTVLVDYTDGLYLGVGVKQGQGKADENVVT